MTKTLRVRFWFIRVSQGYSKDFHCLLHKTPKLFFHHHFTLTSGRSQFHFPPLFPPQLPSVSHFLRLITILVTVIITGTKYLIETNNERKDLSWFKVSEDSDHDFLNYKMQAWQETHIKEEAIKMARKQRARKQGHRRRCFQRPPNIVWLPREGHQLGA